MTCKTCNDKGTIRVELFTSVVEDPCPDCGVQKEWEITLAPLGDPGRTEETPAPYAWYQCRCVTAIDPVAGADLDRSMRERAIDEGIRPWIEPD